MTPMRGERPAPSTGHVQFRIRVEPEHTRRGEERGPPRYNGCYTHGMSETTQVRKVGNSLGVILNKALLQELDIQEGDTLFVVKTSDGIRLTSYDPDFAEAMEAGRDYMKRHRDALRELAK